MKVYDSSFGNNFATPSSVQSSPAGDYLLRYVPNRAEWGLQSSEESNSSFPYQGYINSPTTDGVFLGRILVKNNSTDLKHVQSLVEASKIATVPSNRMEAMSLTKESLEPYQSSNNTARTVLQLLANFHDTNRPFNVSSQDQHHLRAELAKAGIRNGTYHQPSNLNLTEAYELAMKSIQTSSKSVTQPFNNGWSRNVPQGLFGDHYLDRAVTAGAGYLEQTSDQALYPMRAHKTMNLNANESYLYTFSGKPPLKDGGFWSLTLYNSAGYLTENSLNRYALGDRSNLTYSDGTAVYGAHSDDKPFQVLIQRGDVAPLSNWTNKYACLEFSLSILNRLLISRIVGCLPPPTPATFLQLVCLQCIPQKNCTDPFLVRFFAPKPELVNAAYEYPIVVKEAAK